MDQIELETRLDRDARRFLAAVNYYGGEATTSEIRLRTGLSRSKTHTRYGVLEECGLIDVTYAEHGYGDRDPPKIAHITGKARAAIERGILHGIDADRSNEELNDLQSENRALREEIADLRSMVNVLRDGQHQHEDRFDDIEHDIIDVIYPWTEVAEDEIRANRQACRTSEYTLDG